MFLFGEAVIQDWRVALLLISGLIGLTLILLSVVRVTVSKPQRTLLLVGLVLCIVVLTGIGYLAVSSWGDDDEFFLMKVSDVNPEFEPIAALGRIGPEAIPVLTILLKDENSEIRTAAAQGLRMGPKAKAAVPALMESLQDKDFKVRRVAMDALGSIGPEAKAAVPALTEVLKCKGKIRRVRAASALGRIGPEAKTAVPALTELLKDKDSNVKSAALWALGQIGPEAKAAVPALLDAAQRRARVDSKECCGSCGQNRPQSGRNHPRHHGVAPRQ